MTQAKERFVVDERGRRVAVLLDMKQYEGILSDLEELASVRAYDAAKASGDEAVPLEQALSEIERSRR